MTVLATALSVEGIMLTRARTKGVQSPSNAIAMEKKSNSAYYLLYVIIFLMCMVLIVFTKDFLSFSDIGEGQSSKFMSHIPLNSLESSARQSPASISTSAEIASIHHSTRYSQPHNNLAAGDIDLTSPSRLRNKHSAEEEEIPRILELPARPEKQSQEQQTASEMKQETPSVPKPDDSRSLKQAIDPDYDSWSSSVYQKMICMQQKKIALYLYHVRKAAGTSVRDMMRLIAFRQRIPFYETEGIVLNPQLLTTFHQQIFSLITLRDPISRIFSLYWYEHVGWYYGILKQPQKCKNMETWMKAWKDGATLKKTILAKFPLNNYVEIENYYTKLLIGYNAAEWGNRPLNATDLEHAKAMLRKFDLVLITEWLNDESEHNLLDKIHHHFYSHNSNQHLVIATKVKGDSKMRDALSSTLTPNAVSAPSLPPLSRDFVVDDVFRYVFRTNSKRS